MNSPSLEITPISHPLKAAVHMPGSKSLTARALLIASLAQGRTRLVNALFSDDSLNFASALRTLGFDIQLDEAKSEIVVNGLGGRILAKKAEVFVGNSGAAARFLTALLTLGNGEYILDGEPRLRERPIGDLVEALNYLGAKLEATDGRFPPVKIIASGLPGGRTRVSGIISSQFLSALLMVAPYAKSSLEIEVTAGLNSEPYVDMTLAIMKEFGVQVERENHRLFTVQPKTYSPCMLYPIEPDASAASYFFAAPAVCGGTVRVEDIAPGSKQGDMAFLDVLRDMGCGVREAAKFIEVSGAPSLHGVDVDLRHMPDTAQTLAAVAPFALSSTRIRGIASARLKETDRVHATCEELTRLGVAVEEHEDGLTIYPCRKFRPAVVRTYNDHRMAMAFSLIGLRVEGVTIENPSCVSKTFPKYFEVLESLR